MDVTDRIDEPIPLPDAAEPGGRKTTPNVTRFLAAAAYLDETFRDEVIFQTLYEKYRFIAPSYGVNIGCVVRHCMASRRLSQRRDVILATLIILGVWALRLALLFSAAVFVGALLVAIALTSPRTKLRWRILLSIVAYIGIVSFAIHPLSFLTALAALFAVAADTYERRYRVVARHMQANNFNPDAPGFGRERPRQRAADERRIAHLAAHQDGNVVVYSGYAPFKGSGVEVRRWSWSFAIDVTEASREPGQSRAVDPVEATDVYTHLVEGMNNLHLEGLSVADRYYASGRHVRGDPQLFFQPREPHDRFPRLRYVIDDVSKLEAKPPEMVRHYADIKAASWHSELILSAFVRFTRTSRYLFVETTYYVLPPLKGSYYEIGRYNTRPTLYELYRLFVDSLTRLPLLWLESPIRVAKWMARPIYLARREQRIGQDIRANRRFDFGALGSVRESGSDTEYAKFFQEMDIVRLHKIIDRHLLTSIRKFLQGKGVDTTELERDMRVVINKGIWLSANQTGGADLQEGGMGSIG